MDYNSDSVFRTLEEAFADLPPEEVKAHEKSGAFKYIPLHHDKFIEQLCIALGLLLANDSSKKLKFIDVGCGIGTKLMLAADISYNIVSHGIEINAQYVAKAKKLMECYNKKKLCGDNVRIDSENIILGDARKHDFSPYDILYFYCPMLDTAKQVELEAQLYKTAKEGALILANLKKVMDTDDKNHSIKAAFRPISGSWTIYEKVRGKQAIKRLRS